MAEGSLAPAAGVHPEELAAAESLARARADAIRREYVAFLEAEHARLVREGAQREADLEAELNDVRHQAHLLGALVQEMQHRRAYRVVTGLGRAAAPLRRMLAVLRSLPGGR